MQHFVAPLIATALLGMHPASAQPALVQLPEVTITAGQRQEVYVPIKYVPQAAHAEPELARASVRPTEWMPKVRRCSHRGRRRFCDGPRMVPVPHGEAAARAERLGLGSHRVVSKVMLGTPEQAWIDEVGSKTHATMQFPVDGGRVGRGVGFVRRASLRHRRHEGVDIAAMPGTNVRSVEDGLVLYADNGISGYGNLVVVLHADGTSTFYAHLSEAWVFAGQRVGRGQVVGAVGSTGLSYGPHLHFEWRRRGRAHNPIPQFEEIPEPSEETREMMARARAHRHAG